MKKALVPFLVLGLLLLGVSPAMAAGADLKIAPAVGISQPTQAEKEFEALLLIAEQPDFSYKDDIVAAIPTPEGVRLDDLALSQEEGEGWLIPVVVALCFLFGPCSSPAY